MVLAAAALLFVVASLRVPATDARVVVVGHHPKGKVQLAWAGSELRARFTGTSFAIDVDEKTPADAKFGETDRLAVVVDGARSDIAVPPGASVLWIAERLAAGEHEVSIVKRTEPLVGELTVKAILLDDGATLLPSSPRTRRIEVVGDSLATAYGVTGAGPDCPFSADTQDATLSFASIVARKFDADLVEVAWSGRGVYRDYAGKTDVPTVPQLFAKAPALDGAVDVVVVELGSNDFLSGQPDRGKFMAAYHALLDNIRRRAPKAWIVLASPMPTSSSPTDPVAAVAPTWMNAIVHKRGDGRLSWVQLPARDDGLGLGCTWHPGAKMHERLAAAVAAEIAARMKW